MLLSFLIKLMKLTTVEASMTLRLVYFLMEGGRIYAHKPRCAIQ